MFLTLLAASHDIRELDTGHLFNAASFESGRASPSEPTGMEGRIDVLHEENQAAGLRMNCLQHLILSFSLQARSFHLIQPVVILSFAVRWCCHQHCYHGDKEAFQHAAKPAGRSAVQGTPPTRGQVCSCTHSVLRLTPQSTFGSFGP